MNWFRIPKEKSIQPSSGTYHDWKGKLAEEGKFQCVYCCINETAFGGIRNFHVEHFRPKSFDRFKDLENVFQNLYYACSICNCFKSNDWPNDPDKDLSVNCYAEPSHIDYTGLFNLKNDYTLEGLNVASKYMVEKLFLNRPQLILARKDFFINMIIKDELSKLNHLVLDLKMLVISSADKDKLLYKAIEVLFTLSNNLIGGKNVRPYKPLQIKRT